MLGPDRFELQASIAQEIVSEAVNRFRKMMNGMEEPYSTNPEQTFDPSNLAQRDELVNHVTGWTHLRRRPVLPTDEKLEEEIFTDYIMDRYVIVPLKNQQV